jgi:gp178|nr:MAG TPA: Protein of unknown function (DUF1642) [Caudoviricetes sp.]
MNKQELIDYCNAIKENKSQIINCIDVNEIIKKIEQLDEPQKVTIPQFVADWIEKCKVIKKFKASLAYALNSEVWSENNLSDKCIDWLYNANNQEIFARAWLDGYEVEKEKRYIVKMKNLRALFCYLAYIPDEGYWTFMASGGKSIVIKHTRKELEDAGFGEVFNSQMFEVEEVEE